MIKLFFENISNRFKLFLILVSCYLFLYSDILSRIIELWSDTTGTYGHGFLIFGLCIYLFYKQYRKQRVIASETAYWALFPLMLLLLVAYFSSDAVRLLTLPLSLFLFAVYVFGWQVAKCYIGIFALLYFALPGWGVFTTPLRYQTVYVVKSFLQSMDIPAYIEGAYITLPYGKFFVAEGCSGLRYFLVGTTMSVLYAFTLFKHWKHRITFLMAGIVVSVIANWVRVIVIVLMGYYTKMETSLVDDHYSFGWFVFVAMLAPVVYLGFRFQHFDDDAAEASAAVRTDVNHSPLKLKKLAINLIMAVMVMGLPMLLQLKLDSQLFYLNATDMDLKLDSYQLVSGNGKNWKPNIHQYDFKIDKKYSNSKGEFDLFVFGYQKKRDGQSLSDSQHLLIDENKWHITRTRSIQNKYIVMEIESVGSQPIKKNVYLQYNIAGMVTNNKYIARVSQDLSYLLGEPVSLMVLISFDCDISCDENDSDVEDLMDKLAPKFDELLDQVNSDVI